MDLPGLEALQVPGTTLFYSFEFVTEFFPLYLMVIVQLHICVYLFSNNIK